MENSALIDSFDEFRNEKNIKKETLMAILEDSIRNVLKKKYDSADNYDIIINPEKGDLEIWRNRTIVKDGFSEDDNLEIELAEAKLIEPDFELGEEISEEVKIIDLGRRAILALRQNLISKIYEHDNQNIYLKFKDFIGEVISGEVHYVRKNGIIIMDEEDNEMFLPREEQIPSDFFRKGDNVKAIVKNVELRGNKPVIVLSRIENSFLEKLFEQEIPEILEGLITVRKVERIPGEKAKVAVESYDERIDPVGACVGMKGARIHTIVRELKNENIDVINFTENISLFITRSLSPAKVIRLDLDEEAKKVKVYIKADEVSLAIGRAGTNIRLASKLTGYEIDVYRDGPLDEDVELKEFSDEIEGWVIEEFQKIGLDTAKSILESDVRDLAKRTDLEEETILEVVQVLKSEFEK